MRYLELSARKQAILTAVVKAHIKTGEPIGSKLLSSILDFGLSSATLRNEMSELCELGLLQQPHTSAGRIPSVLGYRMYVNFLMKHSTVSAQQKQTIDRLLENLPDDPQYIPSAGAELLSEFTGLTAISATNSAGNAYVKHIEVIPVSRKALLLVLITSDGTSKSRMCRTEFDLTADDLNCFNRMLKEYVLFKKLSLFNKVYLQNIVSASGFYAIRLIPIISQLFNTVNEVSKPKFELKGEANLFGSSFAERDALKLLKMLSRTDTVTSMLKALNNPINVIFADSSDMNLERPPCMIIANYSAHGNAPAQIGVIGPARISYENIIPSIEYFAKTLGSRIKNALNVMED